MEIIISIYLNFEWGFEFEWGFDDHYESKGRKVRTGRVMGNFFDVYAADILNLSTLLI